MAFIFLFRIGDQEFSCLCLLIDGICSEISRLVKIIQERISKNDSNYATLQESSQKSVERVLDVL